MATPNLPSILEASYEEATHRARRFLASRFALDGLDVASPDYPGREVPVPTDSARSTKRVRNQAPNQEELRAKWREVWRLDIREALLCHLIELGSDIEIPANLGSILLAVSPRFPDELPVVYLPLEEFDFCFPLPHLDRKRLLCTFDATEFIPDCNYAPQIALAVVERALELLVRGLCGANSGDYDDEFAPYWAQECQEQPCVSLVEISANAAEVWSFPCVNVFGASHLLSSTKEEAQRFAIGVKGSVNMERARRALYLPLPELGKPPFPATNAELWHLLGKVARPQRETLLRFLAKTPRPCAVLFSVPAPDDQSENSCARVAGVWWHPKWDVGQTKRGGKAGSAHAAAVAGFRPGVASVTQEMTRVAGQHALIRQRVERLDVARLCARTKGGATPVGGRTINVVGCGSVGSQLAAAIAASGEVGAMTLYDPQILTVENVPRHLCDLTQVGQFKVEAVQQTVARRAPHIEFQTHSSDILDVLRLRPDALKSAALTIVGLGDFAVERRLNRLSLEQPNCFSPLCFVWVEPYALGGHAIWLPQRDTVDGTFSGECSACFECAFDSQLLFASRIVHHPLALSRREAGCQTTYTPYGGPDFSLFLVSLSRFVLHGLLEPPRVPLLWSWAGDLESASNRDVEICNPFGIASFSSQTHNLAARQVCVACGARK